MKMFRDQNQKKGDLAGRLNTPLETTYHESSIRGSHAG
jgi:hypothetical protein